MDSSQPTPPGDSQREADEKFLKEWEAQLEKPRVGVFPFVAGFAILATLFFMFQLRNDLSYFLSEVTPIELGAEGNYFENSAQNNRYAQVHGIPSLKGWYVDEKAGPFVIVGISDSPFLLRRKRFADETIGYDGKPRQPKQNPFFAKGRLVSREEASRYAAVFTQYETWSGTKAKFILLAEESPREDRGVFLSFILLTVFGLVNLWLLLKSVSLSKQKNTA
jgi:hypothetical protein